LVTVKGYWVAARLGAARPASPKANVMVARIWRMENLDQGKNHGRSAHVRGPKARLGVN
jgi:hypothetical protein